MNKKIGILIVNLGTPSEPTAKAVKEFLLEFLSDPRVIDLPKIPWQVLLRAIILPLRCHKVAKNYQKIWTKKGSPLMVSSQALAKALQAHNKDYSVSLAMTYGRYNIKQGLLELRQHKIDKLLIIPLYPQYSSTTTAAVFDSVTKAFGPCPDLPEMRFIKDYYNHPLYINALATQIKNHYTTNENSHLLISFHGLPQRYCDKGDPYEEQCYKTADLLAMALNLDASQYSVCFQSRFGKAKWLEPSTENTVKSLAAQGKLHLSVICPGFATDCLETLEEIAIGVKQVFIANGGETLMYIPALNDTQEHILLLNAMIKKHSQGWD